MQQIIHLLFAGVLLTSVLPMTAWGYGAYDYYSADRSRLPSAGTAGGHYHSSSLRLQTAATAEGYYVRAYLEGLTPEDVQVYVRHNRLYLRVAQGERRGPQTGDIRNSSQWQMHYSRQLRLPYDADWMQIRTTTKNGVMEIYMPRRGR